MKELKRSKMSHRLDSPDLFRSSIEDITRLAAFLGIDTTKKENETDAAHKSRLVYAIQRWEKRYAQGRNVD